MGSQVKISARNRNFQRKANVLEINLGGGFETQVGGRTTNVSTNAYSFNAEVALTLPRFYTPLIYFNPRTPYVPRTRFSVGYELLNRPALVQSERVHLAIRLYLETDEVPGPCAVPRSHHLRAARQRDPRSS